MGGSSGDLPSHPTHNKAQEPVFFTSVLLFARPGLWLHPGGQTCTELFQRWPYSQTAAHPCTAASLPHSTSLPTTSHLPGSSVRFAAGPPHSCSLSPPKLALTSPIAGCPPHIFEVPFLSPAKCICLRSKRASSTKGFQGPKKEGLFIEGGKKPGCPWVLLSQTQQGRVSGLSCTGGLQRVGRRGVPAATGRGGGETCGPSPSLSGGTHASNFNFPDD